MTLLNFACMMRWSDVDHSVNNLEYYVPVYCIFYRQYQLSSTGETECLFAPTYIRQTVFAEICVILFCQFLSLVTLQGYVYTSKVK